MTYLTSMRLLWTNGIIDSYVSSKASSCLVQHFSSTLNFIRGFLPFNYLGAQLFKGVPEEKYIKPTMEKVKIGKC